MLVNILKIWDAFYLEMSSKKLSYDDLKRMFGKKRADMWLFTRHLVRSVSGPGLLDYNAHQSMLEKKLKSFKGWHDDIEFSLEEWFRYMKEQQNT